MLMKKELPELLPSLVLLPMHGSSEKRIKDLIGAPFVMQL